jgi:hypothetical protein
VDEIMKGGTAPWQQEYVLEDSLSWRLRFNPDALSFSPYRTGQYLGLTRLPFTRPSPCSPFASTALAFPLDEEVDGSAGRDSSALATLECRRFRL